MPDTESILGTESIPGTEMNIHVQILCSRLYNILAPFHLVFNMCFYINKKGDLIIYSLGGTKWIFLHYKCHTTSQRKKHM